MKKLLVLVLSICLVAFSSMTALAATETVVSLETDNIGRGAGLVDLTVIKNADGSVLSKSSNISFYLPETVVAGETVSVHVKGSSAGDFRVWLIDVNETTNTEIYQASANGFTTGEFDYTFNLTAVGEATEIFFKAPTYDGKIDNLNISYISVTKGGSEAAPAEAEEVAEVVEAEVTASPSVPKTGEKSIPLVYLAVAAAAGLVAIVASKKKTVNE